MFDEEPKLGMVGLIDCEPKSGTVAAGGDGEPKLGTAKDGDPKLGALLEEGEAKLKLKTAGVDNGRERAVEEDDLEGLLHVTEMGPEGRTHFQIGRAHV